MYTSTNVTVFDYDTEEYKKLQLFSRYLNEHSPNRHRYVVKDVLFEPHSDVFWTTIIDTNLEVQALSPKMWEEIVYEDYSFSELLEDFIRSDGYDRR